MNAVRHSETAGAAIAISLSLAWLVGCDPAAKPESAGSVGSPAVTTQVEALAPDWSGEFESPTGTWRLRYRTRPDPIVRNELFELDVELLSDAGNAAITGVEAFMPEHLHGTTLQPNLHALGAGKYRVEGLLLHMSGFWELFFRVENGADSKRVRFEIVLE